MKYRLMVQHRGAHGVGKMAEVLGVSRSGYHAWCSRREGPRAAANRELTDEIRVIQKRVKHRYGSPRVTAALRRGGRYVGHNRVARLMRVNGLQARPKRRFRLTTKACASLPVAENLLGRNFEVRELNRVWVSDITYIPTAEGWLYLAVIMDLCSRRIVGWAMSTWLGTQLLLRAFAMAVLGRRPPKGLLFHSDRGSQYASHTFREAVQRAGMRQSMSRKGDCWDNAPSESWFKTLKTELLQGRKAFASRLAGRAEIFEYVEVFYNRQRLHSSLGNLTPVEFEQALEEGYLDITQPENVPLRPTTEVVPAESTA
jgi:transposase InsO family protein